MRSRGRLEHPHLPMGWSNARSLPLLRATRRDGNGPQVQSGTLIDKQWGQLGCGLGAGELIDVEISDSTRIALLRALMHFQGVSLPNGDRVQDAQGRKQGRS